MRQSQSPSYLLIRVNDFILYDLKVIENFVMKLAFKAWVSASVGFEIGTFRHRVDILLHSVTLPKTEQTFKRLIFSLRNFLMW